MPKLFALSIAGLCLFVAIFFGRSFLLPSTDFVTLASGPFRAAYLVEDDAADFDFIQVVVQSGEVDHDGPEGLAHYVEHLAWLNQLVVKDAKTSRHSNAWTSKLATGYFVSGPTEDLARNLERLASTAKPYPLKPAFISQERGIVLREFGQRVGESATYPVRREIETTLFAGSAMNRSVLGTPETINAFNAEIAAKLHARSHKLSNMVLIAHGKMDAAELTREIERLGTADPVPVTPIPLLPTDPLRDEKDIEVPKIAADNLFFEKIVALPGAPATPEISAAIWVLDYILDSTSPGGVGTPLRFDNFIAQSYKLALFEQAPDSLRLSFSARPDVDVDLTELQAAFEATMADIYESGISQEVFAKVKTRLLERLEDTKDQPAHTLGRLVEDVTHRRAPTGYSSDLKAMSDLALEDVNALLSALSQDGRTVIRRARKPQNP